MLRIVEYFHGSDTGRARPVNEDAHFARPPLFAVADGMGGAQAGEVASSAALELFEAGLPDGDTPAQERLAALVGEANLRVHELSRADSERAGMGTTLTAAYLGEDDLAVAHVGDSRLYRLRDGSLSQRTDDHSLVGELVRRGQLSPEEAEDHPQRSIITRALGPDDEVAIDSHTLARARRRRLPALLRRAHVDDLRRGDRRDRHRGRQPRAGRPRADQPPPTKRAAGTTSRSSSSGSKWSARGPRHRTSPTETHPAEPAASGVSAADPARSAREPITAARARVRACARCAEGRSRSPRSSSSSPAAPAGSRPDRSTSSARATRASSPSIAGCPTS